MRFWGKYLKTKNIYFKVEILQFWNGAPMLHRCVSKRLDFLISLLSLSWGTMIMRKSDLQTSHDCRGSREGKSSWISNGENTYRRTLTMDHGAPVKPCSSISDSEHLLFWTPSPLLLLIQKKLKFAVGSDHSSLQDHLIKRQLFNQHQLWQNQTYASRQPLF